MAKKVIRRSKGTAPKVTGPKAKSRVTAVAKGAKAAAKKAAAKSTRKVTPKRMDEKALKAKYSHVVLGTLKFDKSAGKQTVEIKCKKRNCGEFRRIFTSDLFQINFCKEHVLENRRAKRAAAAKAKREAS